MTILNTNKLTWFKNEGEALQLGYVYVGQPKLDPQVPANQKTVTFTDSQGNEFTAPQPLRTDVDGRVQWNGKPIIATISGDYSLLILDSNKKQINAGWIPTVATDSDDEDLGEFREYGLVLADIKKLDVSVGETVGNVGRDIVSDGLGANWLVVSATGSPANDQTIIDFDNGLQGTLIVNEQGVTPNYAGYTKATTTYSVDAEVARPELTITGNIPSDLTTTTVGPTGSGADVIWSALDALPSDAKSLRVSILLAYFGAASSVLSASFSTRNLGATTAWSNWDVAAAIGVEVLSASTNQISSHTECVIPILDASNVFECRYSASAGDLSKIYLKGFDV